LPSVFVPIATAAGVFLLVLLLFKAPVIYSQINYNLHSHNTPTAPAVAPASDVIPATATISIPKINVNAPVIYEPSVQEAAVQQALQSGVVHYGNTPAPGQPGNVAIFGHSSNDWWEPGNYKFVFVLLDKLSPGDRVTMDFQSKRYTYEVTGSKVVEPTDVGVLSPTATPTLTIITCTPPGTSLKRLVVTAKQIDPDPSQIKTTTTTAAATATGTTSLPSSSTGILGSLSQAWQGILSLFGGDNSSSSGGATPSASGGATQLPASK
jgi:sortase A